MNASLSPRRLARPAALMAAMLALAACASTSRPRYSIAPAPAAAQQTASQRLNSALILLHRGDPRAARAELMAVAQRDPQNATARLLISEIDTDPIVMLGLRSHSYEARPGDTMDSLAQRFLGDARLFYALSRYNGITAPDQPLVGRVLVIPGAAVPHAKAPRPTRVRRERPAAGAPAAAAATVAAAPTTAPRDPRRANALRAAALEDMSRGRIDQAVGLLERSAQLDPGNPLITADLQRARRVQVAVRGRS